VRGVLRRRHHSALTEVLDRKLSRSMPITTMTNSSWVVTDGSGTSSFVPAATRRWLLGLVLPGRYLILVVVDLPLKVFLPSRARSATLGWSWSSDPSTLETWGGSVFGVVGLVFFGGFNGGVLLRLKGG
jgi:hypothetical protein